MLRVARARLLNLLLGTRRLVSRAIGRGGSLNTTATPLSNRAPLPARRQQQQQLPPLQQALDAAATEGEAAAAVQGQPGGDGEASSAARSPALEELRQRRLQRFGGSDR